MLTFDKTFDKCPNCGCTETLAGIAAKEGKEEGVLDPDAVLGLAAINMQIFSPAREAVSAIGTKFPAIAAVMDLCLDCGTYYATYMMKSIAEKKLKAPTLYDPRQDKDLQGGGVHP